MSDNIYTIKKGEKQNIYIKFKNRDEDLPIDLTNAKIKIQIKDELKDEFCIIEKEITSETDAFSIGRILNPKEGELIFRFTDDDYSKLVCERIYYIIIWYIIEEQDYAKVVSSNCDDYLKLKICYP